MAEMTDSRPDRRRDGWVFDKVEEGKGVIGETSNEEALRASDSDWP